MGVCTSKKITETLKKNNRLILLKEKKNIFSSFSFSLSPNYNSCVDVSGLQLSTLVHGSFSAEKDPSLQSEWDVGIAQI